MEGRGAGLTTSFDMQARYRKAPDKWENWTDFRGELKERFKKPAGHPTFIMYFVVVLIIGGGLGVWLPPVVSALGGEISASKPELSVAMSLATYVVAILSAGLADALLSEISRAFRMFALSLCIIGAVIALLALLTSSKQGAFLFSGVGAAISLLLWWLANANDEKLQEAQIPVDAPVGNQPEQTDLPGNTQGYTE